MNMDIDVSMQELRNKKGFLCDMDGVIYHGNRLLEGVKEFVDWLYRENKQFLFLTNSGERSPKELQQKLARLGLDVGEEHFYTSALATAKFLHRQSPGCTAYVIGAPGLVNALYEVGITMNDVDPDYVVVGETATYNFEMMSKAVKYVLAGARRWHVALRFPLARGKGIVREAHHGERRRSEGGVGRAFVVHAVRAGNAHCGTGHRCCPAHSWCGEEDGIAHRARAEGLARPGYRQLVRRRRAGG